MPRFDRYDKLRREISNSVRRASVVARWDEKGTGLIFSREGKNYRFDFKTKKESETEESPVVSTARPRGGRAAAPERGRQVDQALSPDGKWKAFHRDRNVFLSTATGKDERAITTDGSEKARTKNGVASWVYGEELGVREALFWSPDSTKLAFYRFDESEVKDFYLALDQSKFQTRLDAEPYPKAGAPNPKVGLRIFDLPTGAVTDVDISFDSGAGPDLGHYVYEVRWSPKGDELFFHRTDRLQKTMEWVAANPATGKCRVVLREQSPQSWTDNGSAITYLGPSPLLKWLDDDRFLWISERNGYKNIYLYHRTTGLIRPITQHKFEVDRVLNVDEKAGMVLYTARSAENPYLLQLHRIGLDGKNDRRLTDPALSHSVDVSPDGKYFLHTAETISEVPVVTLRDAAGKKIADLAKSDTTKFDELKLRKIEHFTYLAADGVTLLHGQLHFPSDFDPEKRYPLLVGVYGGPESGGEVERFRAPNAITELGFLFAEFDGRGTQGRGKAFKDAVYGKLGIVEIDDQAAGVLALKSRRYVDGRRVGIFGTSYGGYASTMAILRHPDVFQVAIASSSVTDWRHYDSVYTERYMGLPTTNKEAYDAGSALTYAKNLKGRLMLFFGSADNNVHPSNTLMLVQALNSAGKRYDMNVGPDQGHASYNPTRVWEYFVTHLILEPEGPDKVMKTALNR